MFKADFKGTCVLCLDSIKPGHMLVERKLEAFGGHHRFVHAECQRLLEESSPPDLAAQERASVVK